MTTDCLKVGGIYWDRNGLYEITVLDFKTDKIKGRYIHSNKEFTRTGLKIIKRIHENVQDDQSTIWWVCHQVNLWNIDQRLIGFHRKAQFDVLKERNIVIYYRIGEDKIKGVFKILSKGVNINPEFNDIDIESALIYQCRLELLCNNIICNFPRDEAGFSFFDKWSKTRHGGLKIQVFPANRRDLELVIGKESSDNIISKF